MLKLNLKPVWTGSNLSKVIETMIKTDVAMKELMMPNS